jgi:hypothetical protein
MYRSAMTVEGVFTDGESLGVAALIPDASDESAKDEAIRAIVERLHEVAERDGWRVEGEPEIELIATPDDLPQLPPDADDEARHDHDALASVLIPPAAAVFVTQRVTGPDLPSTGLIGTSLIAQTKERLSLARVLDHPGESGRAREEAIRQHIQEFLPGGLRLETGFVVDAMGGQSRQIDLILYFGDYYPVFRVNGLPIVPVEAVIAVFEVKANVGSRAVLTDCYDVLASVKRLDRSNRGTNRVLTGGSAIDIPPEGYEKFQVQVLGAVVAESSIGVSVWFEATQAWCANHPRTLWPNFFVSASSFVGAYQEDRRGDGPAITADTTSAARLAILRGPQSESPLAFLTHEVLNFARVAVRVDYSPMDYLGGSHNLGVETHPF